MHNVMRAIVLYMTVRLVMGCASGVINAFLMRKMPHRQIASLNYRGRQ